MRSSSNAIVFIVCITSVSATLYQARSARQWRWRLYWHSSHSPCSSSAYDGCSSSRAPAAACATANTRSDCKNEDGESISPPLSSPSPMSSSASTSTAAAYHQDKLLEDEAKWIMEEEYQGASGTSRHTRAGRSRSHSRKRVRRRKIENTRQTSPTADFDGRSSNLLRDILARRSALRRPKRRSSYSSDLHSDESIEDQNQGEDWNDGAFDSDFDSWGDNDYKLHSFRNNVSKQNDIKARAHDANFEEEKEEHPLRTDEWLVKVKVSGLLPQTAKVNAQLSPRTSLDYIRGKTKGREIEILRNPRRWHTPKERLQVFRFARNGLVLLVRDGNTACKGLQDAHANRNGNGSDTKAHVAVGKWKLDHTGLAWDIDIAMPYATGEEYGKRIHEADAVNHRDLNPPDWASFAIVAAAGGKKPNIFNEVKKENISRSGTYQYSDQCWRTTTLHYRADVHLNKFGAMPRMFKGVITRDRYSVAGSTSDGNYERSRSTIPLAVFRRHRPKRKTHSNRNAFFRPVIGAFEAVGIGVDTVDTTYRNRGFR